ncbi:MAG TPA: aldo/keto reductase, partial [Aestuariivirgaceae bacterium]|nr:aldo/keto reductase [Aestuariivirgaceae bacterium]
MNYVNLGRSGLKVSRICLGCMSYGSPEWRPWVLDEAAARPFFARALEAGINFFDTADFYSLGASETVTGRHLKAMARRDDVVIATKVGLPMSEAPNAKGLSRKHIAQSIDNSLKRLKTDYVDLYQIHRLDRETPIEEICEALDDVVRSGKALYIGASSMWAWELMKLLGLQEREGLSRFVSMQNHYNLLYREEEREMMPLCQAEGLGVIPWSRWPAACWCARRARHRRGRDRTPMCRSSMARRTSNASSAASPRRPGASASPRRKWRSPGTFRSPGSPPPSSAPPA